MNILSVAQYSKPRFRDIQDRQKIAWITGVSVSVVLNIVLAVLYGVYTYKYYSEECRILPQEIYLQQEDNYYKYNISNFIKETPNGTLQGALTSSFDNNLVLELNNTQIYPIDENILGDTIYVTNNKYTTYGPGDYSLSVADNKITRDNIQIWPLQNKISFKYSKDNINYYYTLSGPQENIYYRDIPSNDSTNIISMVQLGDNKELNIQGTYGDETQVTNGISIIPMNVYGKTNSISIDNTDGSVNNQIYINTIIDTQQKDGIKIDENTQFKNCYNGISINGPVTGSNSGIYINADIGHVGGENDVNSTYGIQQVSGTIQGNNDGISVNGIIKSNNKTGINLGNSVSFENCYNGLYVTGKVNGSNSGIYITGTVGYIGGENDTNSTYGIYQASGTIQGINSGFYQNTGIIQSNFNVISVKGIVKSNNSNGIYIGNSVSFKNCNNGIYIGGKVIGSNSGIYQVGGTIQGYNAGFYQSSGTINSNDNSIYIDGIVIGGNSINVGTSATLTATECKIKNGNTCLLNP